MATKKKTAIIKIGGETWTVPRGFGREYLRVAKLEREFRGAGLIDLLGLIGYTADPADVALWSMRDRVAASVYAANVHARASDNPIPAHPRPSWFPDPWQGPEGDNALDGPGPTMISPRGGLPISKVHP